LGRFDTGQYSLADASWNSKGNEWPKTHSQSFQQNWTFEQSLSLLETDLEHLLRERDRAILRITRHKGGALIQVNS
jgi:hypothetical protein